jgi:hypothetical protein
VTPVIVPLLGAAWYREELQSRARLRITSPDGAAVRAAAERQGRQVAASMLLDRRLRGTGGWRFTGVLLSAVRPEDEGVDIGMVRRQAARTSPRWLEELGLSADPGSRLVQRALRCATQLAGSASVTTRTGESALLERVCELP